MQPTQKRIFVSNLPPDISDTDIKELFVDYGHITFVEIKQRKEVTNNNVSPTFAFVNIEIDERTLNKCFRDLSNYEWHGYSINLQVAKESFLERLKREREEANSKTTETPKPAPVVQENVPKVDTSLYKKTYHSSSSSESSSESEEEVPKTNQKPIKTPKPVEKPQETLDYVIKDNKFKHVNGKSIAIESFSDKPIHVINKNKEKKEITDEKALAADEKRKKSLLLMKNSYQQQKLAIKSALSSVDTKRNNKIVFSDEPVDNKISNKRKNNHEYENDIATNKRNRVSLFNDDDEEDENIDFGIKKQFEGERGQKLLRLQTRYKNDKRFALDSRFADENEEAQEINEPLEEDEKQKQLEILESVLGKKITNKKPKEANSEIQKPRKAMLRFDPSIPEHSKFERKETDEPKERKKKKEKKNEEIPEEETKVEVSKETFYKVTGNLKESLQEKQSFSLLSMFGRAEDKEEMVQDTEMRDIVKTKQFGASHNPFQYDSSDSEDDVDNKTKGKNDKKETPSIKIFKREKFFFQNNDARLEEAFEFLKKLGSEVRDQPFDEKRRQLKKIVKDKIKNNMRNHRPFRKKLGRHKMIKVKKAKKK